MLLGIYVLTLLNGQLVTKIPQCHRCAEQAQGKQTLEPPFDHVSLSVTVSLIDKYDSHITCNGSGSGCEHRFDIGYGDTFLRIKAYQFPGIRGGIHSAKQGVVQRMT